MTSSKRTSALVVAGIAATLLLTACGPTAESGDAAAGRRRHVQHVHRRAREPAGAGQHDRGPGQPGHLVAVDRTGAVRRPGRRRLHRRGRLHHLRRQHDLDGHAEGRLDVPRRHPGRPRASFVDAWNYTAYSPNAQSASYFFANVEGYDALQARDRRRRQRADPAGGEGDDRAEGRRRHDVHRHAERAVRPVAGDRRLLGVLPAARVVLRRPGGGRQAAGRQRPVRGRRAVRAGRRASR